jgi:hypothetical protein
MMRSLAFFISAALFISAPPISKKQQLLLLSKKYFPENYTVLKEYDEASINDLAHGDSLKDYISDVSTIVHEGYHEYQSLHSSYYDSSVLYRINDTLSFSVRNLKTFPSVELNNIVSASVRKKVFRYDTYVGTKDKYLVTQQFGILGLLEESIAYYHSFSTEVSLFNYYKDSFAWKNPDAWINYFSITGAFRYAIAEFELFISWYLQYAKTHYPKTYRDIINNKGLKDLFIFLHNENIRLTAQYDTNRAIILRELKDKVMIMDNFIISGGPKYSGKGLFDTEVQEMNDLLKNPEHKILEELRK